MLSAIKCVLLQCILLFLFVQTHMLFARYIFCLTFFFTIGSVANAFLHESDSS